MCLDDKDNLDFFSRVTTPVYDEVEEIISNIGRPRKWQEPRDFLKSVLEYVKSCEDNPIPVEGIYGKDPENVSYYRPQITTIMGFCVFCRTNTGRFYEYEKIPEFRSVISYARNLFTSKNIALSSAGVADKMIVSRIEGLVDKKEVSTTQISNVVFHIPQLEAPQQKSTDLIEGEDWSAL